MKICPICDKKIDGRWCKNCHKFVTPWELKNDIYINESHSRVHDSDCEYHNPSIQYDKQEYMRPGYEKKIYGTHTGPVNKNVHGNVQTGTRQKTVYGGNNNRNNKNNGSEKTSTGKIIKIIIIAYVIIVILSLLSGIVSTLMENSDGISDFFEELMEGNREKETQTVSNKPEETAAAAKVEIATDEEHEFLAAIEPEYSKSDEADGIFDYYSVDDVQSLGHRCDLQHMDITIDEFMDMMVDVFYDYSITMEGNSDETMNYRWTTPQGFVCVWFDSYYTAECEEFTIYISADTSTNEIHSYEFRSYQATDELYEDLFVWFNKYIPDAFASEEEMKQYMNEIGNREIDKKYCDDYIIKFYVFKDYISITVEPQF